LFSLFVKFLQSSVGHKVDDWLIGYQHDAVKQTGYTYYAEPCKQKIIHYVSRDMDKMLFYMVSCEHNSEYHIMTEAVGTMDEFFQFVMILG